MGTTAQKLQAIQNSKAAIKAAIEEKGVSDVGDVLSEYATKIAAIPGGGGVKYGLTMDNILGDVNQQGALQSPTPGTFYSTQIVSIGSSALKDAFHAQVSTINLPNLTTLGDSAMEGVCKGSQVLTTVNLPSLTHIGTAGLSQAFWYCPNLATVNLSNLQVVGS